MPLAEQDRDQVSLDELAVPFARHLSISDKPGTFAPRHLLAVTYEPDAEFLVVDAGQSAGAGRSNALGPPGRWATPRPAADVI